MKFFRDGTQIKRRGLSPGEYQESNRKEKLSELKDQGYIKILEKGHRN